MRGQHMLLVADLISNLWYLQEITHTDTSSRREVSNVVDRPEKSYSAGKNVHPPTSPVTEYLDAWYSLNGKLMPQANLAAPARDGLT